MSIPEIAESFVGSVNRVTLGATQDSGGTRTSTVTVGGAKNVVYGGSPEDVGGSRPLQRRVDVRETPVPVEPPHHVDGRARLCGGGSDGPGACGPQATRDRRDENDKHCTSNDASHDGLTPRTCEFLAGTAPTIALGQSGISITSPEVEESLRPGGALTAGP